MEHKDYRLAAILFTDIVGFSRMMEKDEAGTLKIMEFHNNLVQASVVKYGGNIIKTIGDAFLIEFSNANNAVRCAVEIQNSLETFNASKPPVPLVLRIGCHLGDIYFYENDALGEGINIASRLQSLAKPGRICMSQEVYNLVSNKVDLPIKSMGNVNLKNITRELKAYEIMTNGSAEAIEDSAKVPEPSISSTETHQIDSKQDTHSDHNRDASHPDFAEIRQAILGAIKRRGRRISIGAARKELPWSGAEVETVLQSMLSQGFLAKDIPEASTSRVEHEDSEEYEPRRERGSSYRRDTSSEFKDVFKEIATEIKREVISASARIKRQLKPELNATQYLEKQENALLQEKKGMAGHLSSYVTVNLGLWFIWFMTTPFGFPWPLIVTLAWGIGMASHWGNLRNKTQEVAQQKALPPLTDRQLEKLRSLFKERRGWRGHLVSNAATMVFLAVLNLITSPGFPWAAFPIIGMLVGLVGHRSAFKAKEQQVLKALADEGLPIEVLTSRKTLQALSKMSGGSNTGSSPVSQEADRIRQRILRQFKSLKGNHPLGDDFVPVLDNYVKQIKELSERSREIDIILNAIPVAELQKEREHVRVRKNQTTNERLITEYDKALEQLEKQLGSHGEMTDEQQVLKLRLNNSLNSLRQLEIDIGRVKSISVRGELPSASDLRARSQELTQYLADLHTGYQEAEQSIQSFQSPDVNLDPELGLDARKELDSLEAQIQNKLKED